MGFDFGSMKAPAGMYFDFDGVEISVAKWYEIFGDHDRRRVALDVVNGRQVSTVWMGLCHGHDGQGRPLIFETMVFGDDEEILERYATRAEALDGHKKICDLIATREGDHGALVSGDDHE